MAEKYISIHKTSEAFVVKYNVETSDHRKIVVLRKFSDVVALVKEQLSEPEIATVYE